VARLVAAKKPAGAAEVLLGFLPTTENDVIADEIRTALAAVAVVDGKAAPALVEALGNKDPIIRAGAAEALTRADVKDQKAAVGKLLTDENPSVRVRVAMARARALDKDAVPVLIDALGQLKPEELWQAEELLLHLGGQDSPTVSLGTDEASRKKCRDAWAEWWKTKGDKIDLAKLGKPPEMLGYTIVLLLDKGLVQEVDRNNKVRWQFEGAQFPLDVQHLPGDRVLLAEMQGDRVTERDHKGDVKWEKKIAGPLMAQRLPNGNTFMANRLQLLEVDAKGNEVFTHILPNGDSIMRAVKLRNGDIGVVTMSQQFLRLDAKGKQLSTFNVNVQTSGGRIDVLPNGHVLVPEMRDNKVVEYDRDGKAVWEVAVDQPIVATRLRNGHTLVTSMTENRAVEFDRTGKQVWEFKSDTRVNRAVRR
ncbi:MAG: PQQ-binding-like beta-propeller repeat protein, partial [Gemmataceae bacterium]